MGTVGSVDHALTLKPNPLSHPDANPLLLACFHLQFLLFEIPSEDCGPLAQSASRFQSLSRHLSQFFSFLLVPPSW